MSTQNFALSTGDSVQIHYYKNIVTNQLNYNIDFKIKTPVHAFPLHDNQPDYQILLKKREDDTNAFKKAYVRKT